MIKEEEKIDVEYETPELYSSKDPPCQIPFHNRMGRIGAGWEPRQK